MTGWSPPEGAGPTPPTPPDATAGAPPYPSGYGTPYGGYGYGWPAPAAPRPGIIPLRPIGLGEVLDGSFTAIRTAPAASLGIAAIVMLVNQAIFLLIDYTLLRPVVTTATNVDGSAIVDKSDAVARGGAAYIATTVLTSIELLLLTGVMAAIIGERVVGRRVTWRYAWARLRPVVWPLVRVVVLITFIVGGTVAVAVVPGIAVAASGASTGGAALLAVGLLLIAVPVVYVWTTFSLAPAAVVLERQGARAAMRRSRKLAHGSWWRVFGISALALVIAWVVGVVLSLPFIIFGGGLHDVLAGRSNNLSFYTLLMRSLGGFVSGTLARPFQAGVSALLYVDRRMRAEGLDMALQQAAAAESTNATVST